MAFEDDESCMQEALNEAPVSQQNGDWPIGCVVVLNDQIIARTHNQVYSTKDKLAHAEMLALRQVQDILRNSPVEATLYTTNGLVRKRSELEKLDI